MKREPLLGRAPRMDREVFAIIGSIDFAAGIPVDFSWFYPATVSDSETVFFMPTE